MYFLTHKGLSLVCAMALRAAPLLAAMPALLFGAMAFAFAAGAILLLVTRLCGGNSNQYGRHGQYECLSHICEFEKLEICGMRGWIMRYARLGGFHEEA